MAFREFDGELDAPKSYREFDGELDAPEKSVMDDAPEYRGAKNTAGIEMSGGRLSTIGDRAMDIAVDRAMQPAGSGPVDTMAETSRFIQGSTSPRIADQEAVTRKPEQVLADSIEGAGRYTDKIAQEEARIAAERAAPRKETAEESPYGSAAISGISRIGSNIADIPQFLNDAIKFTVINPILAAAGHEKLGATTRFAIAKDLEQAANEFSPEVKSIEDVDLSDPADLGRWAGINALQQAPQLALGSSAAFIQKLRNSYLALMGAMTAAGEHQRNVGEGVAFDTSVVDAATKGAFEVIGESLGFNVYDKLGGAISKMTAGQRATFAHEMTKRALIGAGAMAGQMASGAVEEGVTQLGQNASSKYVLKDGKTEIADGLINAMAVGALIEGPTAVALAGKAATTPMAAYRSGLINNKPQVQPEEILTATSTDDAISKFVESVDADNIPADELLAGLDESAIPAPSINIPQGDANVQPIIPAAPMVDTGSSAAAGDNTIGGGADSILRADVGTVPSGRTRMPGEPVSGVAAGGVATDGSVQPGNVAQAPQTQPEMAAAVSQPIQPTQPAEAQPKVELPAAASETVAQPVFGTNSAGKITLRGVPMEQIKAVRDKLGLKGTIIGKDSAVFPKGADLKTLQAAFNVEPVATAPKQKKPQRASTDLLQRIKQLGGVDVGQALDITGEPRAPGGWKFAFRKGGTGLDDLATQLAADGFQIDTNDVDGGVQQLRDMIRSHINGNRNFKAAQQEDAAQAEADSAYASDLIKRAQELGINWKSLSQQQLDDSIYEAEDAIRMDALAEREAISDEGMAAAGDLADMIDDGIDVPFGDEVQTDDAALAAFLGEDYEKAEQKGGASAGEDTSGRAQEGAERGARTEQEPPVLESYTNAEVLKREETAKKAEEEAAKEEPAKKETVDQADMFATQGALFNSNRQPAERETSSEQAGNVKASDDPAKWEFKTAEWKKTGAEKVSKVSSINSADIYLERFDKSQQPYGIGQATAVDGSGNVVGTAFYDRRDDGRLEASVEVAPGYRRKGIASAMYDAIESVEKEKLAPNPGHSNDAAAFWASREKNQSATKKLEVLKAQAAGKITGDQGAALKELADAGEHAAVDEVLKPAVRDATTQERIASEKAAPVNDLNDKPTGWKRVEGSNNDSVTLVSYDGKKSVRFVTADKRSGTASVRMNAEAQAYAIDNPYQGSVPEGELVTKPMFAERADDAKGKIDDFGEKIAGAKKEYAAAYKDRMAEAKTMDVLAQPLSKSWPEPDYQKLVDSGSDKLVVGLVRSMRDEIPNKPGKSYRQATWAKQVELLRDTADQLLNDKAFADKFVDDMKKVEHLKLDDAINGRAELYALLGHEKSLKGISISRSQYGVYNGVTHNPPKIIWEVTREAKATAFGNMPRTLGSGDTRQAAIDAFTKAYSALDTSKEKSALTKFELYANRYAKAGDKGQYFIGKKVGRNVMHIKDGFDTVKEARAYMAENNAELTEILEKKKAIPSERYDTNKPRVGQDMRDGQDVTPQMFQDAFSFRGVQFGNYVEGARRQKDLNDAYDALMDLAAVLDIPPKALSLNGELGLAFGARGSGGVNAASAHYEPGQVVINLTKGAGAGSLAHEWWHSLSNYFSRAAGQNNEHATERLDVSLASRDAAYQFKDDGIRKEMIDAFGAVVKSIKSTGMKERSRSLDNRRSKEYWGTGDEMAARAFERYVIAKLHDNGFANDYLANVVSEEYWNAADALGIGEGGSYPYPTESELPVIRGGFDAFFQAIESKETDKGVALFSQSQSKARNPHTLTTLAAAIDKAMGSGFTKLLEATEKFKLITSDRIGDYLGDGAKFSKAQDQTETAAFKQWFGDSKVVDADGKPLVVYHGTRRKFNEFEVMHPRGAVGNPKGIYFTTSRQEAEEFAQDVDGAMDEKSRIVEAYLSIQSDSDGAIRKRADGTTEFIVFDPTKIKSAIGNNGQFDPANPDIRYSKDGRILAFVVNGQTYLVADNIGSDDSVSGLLKHELGVHALTLGRTDAEFQKILAHIESLRKMGNKKIQAARDRVPTDTPVHLELEEQAGYLIEMHPELSVVEKLIARFRALLRKIGAKLPVMQRMKWFKWADALTVEDVVYMATQATKRAPNDLAAANDRGGTYKSDVFEPKFSDTNKGFALKMLWRMTRNDWMFRSPTSDSKSMASISDDIHPGKFKVRELPIDTVPEDAARKWQITFTAEEGGKSVEKTSSITENFDKEIFIDVSTLKQGERGSEIYQIAATYAHNTGRVFVPDPNGVTTVAVSRRIENLLSSALRFGTTEHLLPSDIKELDWKVGDDLHNIEQMIEATIQHTSKSVDLLEQVEYDFTTDKFILKGDENENSNSDQVEFTKEDFGRAAKRSFLKADAAGSGAEGIGSTTLQRAVFAHSILRQSDSARGRQLLSEHDTRTRQLDAPIEALDSVYYSRSGNQPETDAGDQPNNLPQETKTEAARRVGQDAMLRFRVIQDWLKEQGVKLSEAADVYVRENLSKATTANKIEDFRNFEIEPLIKNIAKAGFDLNDITDYLQALHIPEANARMRKIHNDPDATANGITDAEAKKALAEFQAMPKFEQFKGLSDQVHRLGSQTLEMRYAEGLVSKEQYDAYNDTYVHWIPLRGNMLKQQGFGRGMSTNAKQKRRFGHEQRDEFILENLVADRERAIFQIEHNKLGRAVANFILEANNEDIGTISKPERQSVLKDSSFAVAYNGQILSAFNTKQEAQNYILKTVSSKNGSIQGLSLNAGDFDIHKTNDPHVAMMVKPMLAENEIQVYINGHAVRMQLNDPLLARAATNAGIEQLAGVMYVARQINGFLSKAYTAWSPDFLFVNPVRDIYQGSVVLTGKEGIGFTGLAMKNYAWAWKELWTAHNDTRESEWVTRYRKAGGNTGGAYLSDIERVGQETAAALQEFMGWQKTFSSVQEAALKDGKSPGVARTKAALRAGIAGGKKIPALGHFLRLMERLNGVFENTLRLATFKAAIESGKTDQQAAVLAKDLMNFNRKGEIANQMGAMYLFFNPAIQGSHVVLQSLVSQPHSGQARYLIGGLMMTAFLLAEAARSGDDEDERDWRNIPDYVKARNLVLKFGDMQVTIPVAYGFGVFHSIGNAMSDLLHGVEPEKVSLEMATSVFENFSVFGNPLVEQDGKVEFRPEQLLPTIPKMAVAPSTNLDGLGRAIQPRKFKASTPDSQNMTRSVRGTLYADVAASLNDWTGGNEFQSGAVDVSPNTLKYWVTSITGGAGRFLGDTANAAYGGSQGVAPELSNIPIARKFVRESDVSDARASFWQIASKARMASESYHAAIKEGDRSAAKEMKQENAPYINMAELADHFSKLAGAKRNKVEQINASDMPLSEKKARIREIERREMEIYDRFLKKFDAKKSGG